MTQINMGIFSCHILSLKILYIHLYNIIFLLFFFFFFFLCVYIIDKFFKYQI